jgi:tripartite-type tricarboxylate transporter receptor subunit TctC
MRKPTVIARTAGQRASALAASLALLPALLPLEQAMAATTGVADYPSRNIRLIVPYLPGAGTDFTGREIAAKITEATKQQVLIDNRPGAGATIGHAMGAKAPPDGYTLLLGTTGGLVSGPALVATIPYDPIKDFTPIGIATYVPYVLAMSSTVPVKNVKELIAMAKAAPGKLNFASPGVGTPNHIGGAMLMTMAGIELTHIAYKSTPLAFPDMVSGNVHMAFQGLLQLQPFIKAGKIHVIGVGHSQRMKSAPDIPLISDTVPGFYNTGWWGLVGPANLPRPIVDKLNEAMNKGLQQPETVQRFLTAGLEVATSTPQEYATLIRNDLQTWRKLIKDANISVDSLP